MKQNNCNISLELLRARLNYDPGSGAFTWACKSGPKRKGDPAGTPSKGYICIGLNGIVMKAHRIAFAMQNNRWPDGMIDHINGDKSDNRISNLREATPFQNQANCKTRVDNKSGVKGVHFHKRIGKWAVQIQKNKKRHCVGYFDNLEEARDARVNAAKSEYGEYANIPHVG